MSIVSCRVLVPLAVLTYLVIAPSSVSCTRFDFVNLLNRRICGSTNATVAMSGPLTDGTDVDNAQTINSYLALIIVMYGGGVLRLGPGVYNLSTPIVLRDNTCIVGSGKDTILRANSNLKSVIKATEATGVSITRCNIDAARDAGNGIEFVSSNYALISHVTVVNTRSDGIRVSNNCTSVHLEHLYIRSTNRNAIVVSESHVVRVTRSMTVNPVKHGVVVSAGSKFVLIDRSTLVGSEVAIAAKPGNNFPGPYKLILRDLLVSKVARTAIWIKRALFTRIVRVRIESAPLCYRVTEAVVARVQGSCNATRTYRGPHLGLSVCAKGKFNKVCCPEWCGTCGAPKCLDQSEKGQCCFDKVIKSDRVCGKQAPPCIFKKL